MSAILFPLRTSVELFEDRDSPAAIERAKEAAVLFDTVGFETGLYHVGIADGGSFDWWTPPDDITPDLLQHTREPIEPGTAMQMFAQAGEGPAHALGGGNVDAAFVAEFHTGILDELEQFSPPWLGKIAGGGLVPGHPITEAVNSLNFRCLGDGGLMPDEQNSFRKSWIYKSFNRDAVIAAHYGAAFNITSLFRPMVERGGVEPHHAGAEALGLVIPNLGALPWESVIEFREHHGSAAPRARLREFEEKVASQDPADAQEFLRGVSQEVIAGVIAAWEELRPSLPESVALEVARTSVAFIPFVGPFIEAGTTGAEIVAEAVRDRRHWLAALMELRPRG